MTDDIADEVRQWGMTPPRPFERTDFTTDEQRVWDEFPDDYQAAIRAVNGGWLDESLFFDVPIVWEHEGHRREGKQAALEELWTWIPLATEEPDEVASVLHQHFGRHVQEEFLPGAVIVIARAAQNSLVALSTRPEDRGAVYYWEWYWNYPWYKDFFEARVRDAIVDFDDAREALGDPEHHRHEEVIDAANYATLLKIADSFSEFVRELHPERAE